MSTLFYSHIPTHNIIIKSLMRYLKLFATQLYIFIHTLAFSRIIIKSQYTTHPRNEY